MTDGASGSETGKLTLSSGGTALEGYFYQLDVSILTALDLVLAKKVARSVVLEPASEEDLEADVENAPGALTEEIKLDAYRLVIRCKLRSTGPWKHEELTRLLARGTERKPAKERLLEPDISGVCARTLCNGRKAGTRRHCHEHAQSKGKAIRRGHHL